MKRLITTAAALALLAAPAFTQTAPMTPAPTAIRAAPSADWTRLVADWEAFERAENPFASAREGDRSALGRWPGIAPADDARRLAALRTFRTRLGEFDTKLLAPEDAFNHEFLTRVVERRIEEAGFGDRRFDFDSEGGFGTTLGYAARSFPTGGKAEAEAWLRLLEGTAAQARQYQANVARSLAIGFTQPRSVVESALQVAEAQAALPVDRDPLLIPLAKAPAGVAPAEHEAMRARARQLIETQIRPAQREWVRFLRQDYLPKARPGLGVGSLPGGREYYAFEARSYTTTSLTPDQIHEVGQSEVRRIRAAMDGVMREAGWTGTFPEFLAFLRSDARFYAKSRQELLDKASEISKRADDRLPSLFRNSLPRLPYGVRPVPQEIEDNYTTGRYNSGSMALGVAGGYIVNTGKLDQRPLYELPALTVHEAVPGHHLQIAISQELGDQPWFRRNSGVTAYTEGWGLYSEFLGEEMGIYRDPYEKFGRLSYEMWRACRLVADTGIHWKGWTLEQARACFRDNSALAPHNIETELQRYVGWPGQALAYKIGELKLKELRTKAEQALGDRFDVRAFHDAVLLGGPLPLDMLERRVDAWIAAGGPA